MSYDVLTPAAARLWSYSPNWASGFDVSRSFRTDIRQSRNNTEQRRALRTNPRIAVEYRTAVQDEDMRGANHFLRAWQNKATIIPDFARWARTTAGAILGATAIVIDPLPVWAAEGQNLVLCGSDGAEEQVLVASVAGTTVNLEDPLASAWPLGSVVRPTFFGLMEGKIGTTRRNRAAAEIMVSLACYPGGEPPRSAGTAWASLNGREIFTPLPDYAAPPSVSAVWPVEPIDYGHGRTAQFRPVEEAARMVECEFNGLTAASAAEVEQFFDRMKGRRTAFWMPICEKDFVLFAGAGSGATSITVTGSDLATDFGSVDYSETEEAVAIFLTDGTTIYRRITDIAASGGNTAITVSAALGTAISTLNVARISLMPLVRFASDEMTMRWRTPLAAGCRLSFQQVRA
jgi:hypothetical protein